MYIWSLYIYLSIFNENMFLIKFMYITIIIIAYRIITGFQTSFTSNQQFQYYIQYYTNTVDILLLTSIDSLSSLIINKY